MALARYSETMGIPEVGASNPRRVTVPPFDDESEAITQVDFEGGAPVAETPARDRFVMMRLDGTDAGQITSVEAEPLLIGRSGEADLVVQERSVSRQHARVVLTSDGVACADLGSRFGTFLNGVSLQTCVVRPSDVVQFGQVARFVVDQVTGEQEKVLHRMRQASVRDALTLAYTRQYFDERLASECSHAVRHHAPLALLLLDLDHFKEVNDRHGHPAGDAVLRYVSGLVAQRLRSSDLLARVGGEEFAVLLRRCDIDGARSVAERVRSAIAARPVYQGGLAIPVTVSIGCAALPADATLGEQLVGAADQRLYLAKDRGRNRVVYSGD